MHVLHVMESTIGGTRRHLVDVAAGQLRAGYDVSIIASTLRDPGFPADLDELARAGAHVTRIPMVREIRPIKDLMHMRQIARVLRERRPDVVHTHSSKAGVLGRRAAGGIAGADGAHRVPGGRRSARPRPGRALWA